MNKIITTYSQNNKDLLILMAISLINVIYDVLFSLRIRYVIQHIMLTRNQENSNQFKTTDITKRLVTRLIYFRRSIHMTQFELASKTHISLRNYQRIESGEIVPKVDVLHSLACALGIEVEQFFVDYKNSSSNCIASLNDKNCEKISSILKMNSTTLNELTLKPEVLKSLNENRQDIICNQHHIDIHGLKEIFISTFDNNYFTNEYVLEFGKQLLSHCTNNNDHRTIMAKFWEFIIESGKTCFLSYCEYQTNSITRKVITLTHLTSRKYSNPVLTGIACDLTKNNEIFESIKELDFL